MTKRPVWTAAYRIRGEAWMPLPARPETSEEAKAIVVRLRADEGLTEERIRWTRGYLGSFSAQDSRYEYCVGNDEFWDGINFLLRVNRRFSTPSHQPNVQADGLDLIDLECRDWTRTMIEKFLGRPDWFTAVDHWQNHKGKAHYSLQRVEDVERTEEFRRALEASRRRRKLL